MTTFMPASTNARAIPRPMPLFPPVMKATLPSTSFIGVGIEGQLAAEEVAAACDALGRNAADVPAAAARAEPSRNLRRARPEFVSEDFERFVWSDMTTPL